MARLEARVNNGALPEKPSLLRRMDSREVKA